MDKLASSVSFNKHPPGRSALVRPESCGVGALWLAPIGVASNVHSLGLATLERVAKTVTTYFRIGRNEKP
jgi:hypothetical protein